MTELATKDIFTTIKGFDFPNTINGYTVIDAEMRKVKNKFFDPYATCVDKLTGAIIQFMYHRKEGIWKRLPYQAVK